MEKYIAWIKAQPSRRAQVNAEAIGCTSQTEEILAWPTFSDDYMWIGICTTGPVCAGYYYRSKEHGEICVGDKRKTGWHLFAFVIENGSLKAYVDGEEMKKCDMSQLGTFFMFHHWSENQFQKEGGFVDDVYIFSDKMDPARDPALAVDYEDKLGITWGKIKTTYF